MDSMRPWKIVLRSTLLAVCAAVAPSCTVEMAPDEQETSSPARWKESEAEQFELDGWAGIGDVHREAEEHADSATTWNAAPERSPPAVAIGGFSPSLFRFVTIVHDDGSGPAGGWQRASTTLNFVDTRHFPPHAWSCTVGVGMPIRPAAYGRISPDRAARMSATIANEASRKVMHSAPGWIPALFCIRFRSEMENIFKDRYKNLGMTITSI